MNRMRAGGGVFEHPVHAIVEKVARVKGVEATDLPPLNDVFDPDALAALVNTPARSKLTVEFTYCGHHVTVDSDDEVSVADSQDRSTATLNAGEH